MSVAAPRQIKKLSRTGGEKPGYVFKLLRIKGYEPVALLDRPYHTEVIDQTEVSLRTDLKGVPITREVVDGELVDVTWWHGKPTDRPCLRCTVADGTVRPVIQTRRAARVRSDNRVPTVKDAGSWHLGCLRVKLAKLGRYGHDVHAGSGSPRCHCSTNADGKTIHTHK